MPHRKVRHLASALAIAGLGAIAVSGTVAARRDAVSPAREKIGVFYFPGWKDDLLGGPRPKPWLPFAAFPDVKPLNGYYQEGGTALLEKQLAQMSGSGISFVVFDQQFMRDGTPTLAQVTNAFLKLDDSSRHGEKFAILWVNHYKLPETMAQFQAMARFWTHSYMHDRDYLKIDGRPQLFLFHWFLAQAAQKMGIPESALLDEGQRIAREEGFPGVDFVDADTDGTIAGMKQAVQAGYAGITAYGYHALPNGQRSHGYGAMDANYRSKWQDLAANAGRLHVFLPMTPGWDRRPWGGSPDPLHDLSRSTPSEFRVHLQAGRDFIAAHPASTHGYGMICCWNEFGEGSYIEPTVGDQGGHLAAVRDIFGR